MDLGVAPPSLRYDFSTRYVDVYGLRIDIRLVFGLFVGF
jgi:hypothetical protein